MKKPIFISIAGVCAIAEIVIFRPVLNTWCRHIETTEATNPAVINGYHALSAAIFLLALSVLIPLFFLVIAILRKERHWKLALLAYCFSIFLFLILGAFSR